MDSRSLAPRQRKLLQSLLQERLGRLNEVPGKQVLAARLTLTHGDEIQGLFHRPEGIVEVVRDLSEQLFRVFDPAPKMRFGVGRGKLTTGAIPSPWAPNPTVLDGPAFHNAREALVRAKDLGRWVCFEHMGKQVRGAPETHLDEALEALFAFMGAIREDWTRGQGLVSIRHRQGFSQAELAAELGVNPSVVSERLKAARYRLLEFGEKAAERLLESIGAR